MVATRTLSRRTNQPSLTARLIAKIKSKASLVLALSATTLQGCVFALVDATTPEDGYQRVETLQYGDSERQQLDIYYPEKASDSASNTFNNTFNNAANNLTLVFFYGGAWQDGKKEDYRFIAQAFTAQGYQTVIPDYRLYPDVLFPDFVKDGAAALAHLAKHQPDRQFVLIGHSAGAHIAALLALNPDYVEDAGADHAMIKAWVGWSGPYDFLPLKSKTLKTIFNGAEDIANTQPINFVTAEAPQALLIQGLDDRTVIPRNTENLTAKLRELDVPVETHYYKGVGHIGTVAALAPLLSAWSSTLNDTLRYLQSIQSDKTALRNSEPHSATSD